MAKKLKKQKRKCGACLEDGFTIGDPCKLIVVEKGGVMSEPSLCPFASNQDAEWEEQS